MKLSSQCLFLALQIVVHEESNGCRFAHSLVCLVCACTVVGRLKDMIAKSHRAEEMKEWIVYAKSPKELIDKLVVLIQKHKATNHVVL